MTDAVLPAEPPLFAATLTPHRSMGRGGLIAVMALAIGFAAFPAIVFLSMGAWPVFGYLGLDVVLIYLAFRLNFKAARAYETVYLTPETLVIRHVTGAGKRREFVLNPAWTRMTIRRHDDMVEDVIVATREKAVAIGRFLPPEEKASFAAAFGPALARVSHLVR